MKADKPLLFKPEVIDIPFIMKEVSKAVDIPIEKFIIKSRKREYVTARQMSMYLAKNFTNLSLASIGSEVAGKDHATVLHAVKTINNLIDTKDRDIMVRFVPLIDKFKKLDKQIKDRISDPSEVQARNIFNTEK